MGKNKQKLRGFTLIELLVVIAIIAILVAFVSSNFLGARQRAKDVKKKAELFQVKNALRMYYNDFNVYPGPAVTASGNTFNGCGSATPPAADCETTCGGQFAQGATGCDNLYMRLLPPATDYSWSYMQQASGDDFCLWTSLENASDADIARSHTRCNAQCPMTTVVPDLEYPTALTLCAD